MSNSSVHLLRDHSINELYLVFAGNTISPQHHPTIRFFSSTINEGTLLRLRIHGGESVPAHQGP